MPADTSLNSYRRHVELLAPARNAEIAIEAIKHGADAVYMGAVNYGARAAAGNSIEDIASVVDFAHRFNVRVYVTVNTIVFDSELADVEAMVWNLYRMGVDALIVQDMSLLRLKLPPIALHASTQCDIRDVAKARFLEAVGFSQLVVARELSLDEMAEICRNVTVPVEAFVHGALCVSYSGDCQAGYAAMRRSANRGECPQICRQMFDLTDGMGRKLIEGRHLLSLRDLNRSSALAEMLDAGVTSFKIEGRLKDAGYVKNVVGAYRGMLDKIIAANPDRYVRSSSGYSEISFTPDLGKSFNRGYTEYFTRSARPQSEMASFDTPKWIGIPVGKAVSSSGKTVRARLTAQIANGDGLGFFDKDRRFHGFRVNKVDGDRLIAARPVDVPARAMLYRNSDRLLSARLESETAQRYLDITMTLRPVAWGIALDVECPDSGDRATVAVAVEKAPARTPQEGMRADLLSKTGDTVFRVSEIIDSAGDIFIPKSRLADLRRKALESLLRAMTAKYKFDYRRPESSDAEAPQGTVLTYHDNVSNRLAEAFYRDHGVLTVGRALEVGTAVAPETRVMTTRYCLRRECGYCLKTEAGCSWPSELYLQSGPMRFRLKFDCAACRMQIYSITRSPQRP